MNRFLSKLQLYVRCYSTSNTNSLKLSSVSYSGNGDYTIDKTVLIIHGLLGSKQNWNSLAKTSQSIFKKVVAVDLRNHGDSPHSSDMSIECMASDIKQLIGDNGYGNAICVGHSLGGKVAMYLALRDPQLLSALVVVDVSPVKSTPDIDFQAYIKALIEAPIDQRISVSANRKIIDQYLAPIVKETAVRNFLLMNLVQDKDTHKIKWRVNLESMSNNMHHIIDFPKLTSEVFTKPTLFIGGQLSKYIRQEHQPFIKRIFPSPSFNVIAGAGHWVHADKPNEFLSALFDFGSNLDCK